MKRAPLAIVFAAVAAAAAAPAPPAGARDEPDTVACALPRAGAGFEGACFVPCLVNALAVDIDGPAPGARCDAPPRRVAAALRPVAGAWLGTMEGKHPEDPTRFEVSEGAGGAAGVAKTPFGWFALRGARLEGDTLALSIAADRQLPPTADDVRIVQRAMALLPDRAAWNKEDDRNCPPNPTRWSVFCALTQATGEVSGGVHYRQPALQAVREVLNEVGGARVGKHRLMDYNNHPDTTLGEIHGLLRTAQARLEERFR